MKKSISSSRRKYLGAALSLAALASSGVHAQSGAPIRIGSTLALTGPLSATAQIHKVVGEIYIEQANKRGGWLGRPLQWVLLDDQSKPDVAINEAVRLIEQEKVDMVLGFFSSAQCVPVAGRVELRPIGRIDAGEADGAEDEILRRLRHGVWIVGGGHRLRLHVGLELLDALGGCVQAPAHVTDLLR